jgi:hypothetical protein
MTMQAPNSAHEAGELAFMLDWPDGTPKSFGNEFTAYLDGRPSCFNTKGAATSALLSAHATAQRTQGLDFSSLARRTYAGAHCS